MLSRLMNQMQCSVIRTLIIFPKYGPGCWLISANSTPTQVKYYKMKLHCITVLFSPYTYVDRDCLLANQILKFFCIPISLNYKNTAWNAMGFGFYLSTSFKKFVHEFMKEESVSSCIEFWFKYLFLILSLPYQNEIP